MTVPRLGIWYSVNLSVAGSNFANMSVLFRLIHTLCALSTTTP
jgi:hypothetical protein